MGETRFAQRIIHWLIITLIALAVTAPTTRAATADGHDFQFQLTAALETDELTPAQALLYRFHYAFAPEQLPAQWRPRILTQLKCGTPLVQQYHKLRNTLSTDTIRAIDGYLSQSRSHRSTETHLSLSGIFRLTYETEGPNAVPLDDVAPANGVPDFVEKIAIYFDTSWAMEIEQLGFTAPPLSPYYEITFQEMNLYGYTDWVSGLSTRIVMHRDYLGFPPNQDPEGNRWGAAKVTAAHELKHASQLPQSDWSEGTWLELDAVWTEDLVFDVVNDYYNYFTNPNSIVHPDVSLDDGGTGSYEDSIWQHWMSETWGNDIVVAYGQWRGNHISEPVMESYATVLLNQMPGGDFTCLWTTFCAWNYATGSRAIAGLGYREAADYPTSTPTVTPGGYPAALADNVAHLAADFVPCQALPADGDWVSYAFNGANGGLGLAAIIEKIDGTGLIEIISLDDDSDAAGRLSVPREDIAAVGFVVTNSALAGTALPWTMTIDVMQPDPALTLDMDEVELTLELDGTSTLPIELANTGASGSLLAYEMLPREIPPSAKSIDGTTLTCNLGRYEPGTTTDLVFSVTNGSTDDEYLIDLWIDVPTGVTVNSSGPFVGGSGGNMESDNTTGDGVRVSWHGDTGSPNYWGVVGNGQTAHATVNVTFAADLTGDSVLDYQVDGDIWGGTPHTVTGQIVIAEQQPELTLLAPSDGDQLAVGQAVDVTWASFGDASALTLELTRDAGDTWEVIATNLADDGVEAWTITGPPTMQAALRISTADGAVADAGPGLFTIYHPLGWITTSPSAGTIAAGESQIVNLTIDAAGLSAGLHLAELCIVDNTPAGHRTVPIRLTVSHATDSTPAALPFCYHRNYPNPFNPTTIIEFTVGDAGPVVVEILDLRGALVRRLWSGELNAGIHTLPWHGRDGNERKVAAGTYLVRLRSNDQQATGKLVLAK